MLLFESAHASLGDDNGELGFIQCFSEVANEVRHVLLIRVVQSLIDPIVPALVPSKTNHFKRLILECWEDVLKIVHHGLNFFQQGEVVFTRLIAWGGGGAKINTEAFATPRDFDQEDRFIKLISGDRSKS